MPIEIQYTATTAELIRGEFRCGVCHHRAEMEVLGTGTGVASAFPFVGESGVQASAVEEAPELAQKDALQSARLVRCPGCGRRNAAAVGRLSAAEGVLALLKSLPVILVVMLVVMVIGADRGITIPGALAVGGGAGLSSLAFFARVQVRRRLREADFQVTFLSPEAAE